MLILLPVNYQHCKVLEIECLKPKKMCPISSALDNSLLDSLSNLCHISNIVENCELLRPNYHELKCVTPSNLGIAFDICQHI